MSDEITVVCDRCKQTIQGMKNDLATGGFYEVGPIGEPWGKFADPGENIICDACMWADPRYIAVYGPVYHGGYNHNLPQAAVSPRNEPITETLGRVVRDTWVKRREQKRREAYIEPWDDMTDFDRETDRQIAQAVLTKAKTFQGHAEPQPIRPDNIIAFLEVAGILGTKEEPGLMRYAAQEWLTEAITEKAKRRAAPELLKRWLRLIRDPSSEDVHALERETADAIGESNQQEQAPQ